jgi:hypothetical protein
VSRDSQYVTTRAIAPKRSFAARQVPFRRPVWLLPAAFVLHVLEEAPGFTAWVNRYASGLYIQENFVRNNAAGLMLTLGTTFFVSRFRNRPLVFLYYSLVLTQQALFNTLFHAGATLPLEPTLRDW